MDPRGGRHWWISVRCGTRRFFEEGGVPERVAAPRRAKVIVRENAFPPAGMVERTHRVRVGVWGRGAPNDRVVSVARCGSGVERQRGSGPAAPANTAIPARRARPVRSAKDHVYLAGCGPPARGADGDLDVAA